MAKTTQNWMPKPLKGAIVLLACLTASVAVTHGSQLAGPAKPNGIAPEGFKGLLVIKVAEPSYPSILAVDLLAAASLMALFRRRIASILK